MSPTSLLDTDFRDVARSIQSPHSRSHRPRVSLVSPRNLVRQSEPLSFHLNGPLMSEPSSTNYTNAGGVDQCCPVFATQAGSPGSFCYQYQYDNDPIRFTCYFSANGGLPMIYTVAQESAPSVMLPLETPGGPLVTLQAAAALI